MNISEIARVAGVSTATVSLVLNRKKGVGAQRRAAIERLLTESGYTLAPRAEAPAPVGKSIRFLKYLRHAGLVNENPGFVQAIIDAVERECRRYKYELLISNADSIEALRAGLDPRSATGFLLLGTELREEDAAFLNEIQAPLVVIDTPASSLSCSAITMDNRAAVFSAVDYLAALGYSALGFLANSAPGGNCAERRRAFADATRARGLSGEIIPVNMTMDGAYASVAALLRGGRRFPPAVIANNDSIAVGAIRAFREAGLDVPGDISVVGFDNIPFSEAFNPPLTTLSVPCDEIGTRALRMLIELIRNPDAPREKTLIGTNLIRRESVRAK